MPADRVRGQPASHNLATKPLGYAANQEAELRRILGEGDLPLDNTRAAARASKDRRRS